MPTVTRRDFLSAGFCLAASGGLFHEPAIPRDRIRALTRGPKYHWFSYYDKLQFDAADRLVLGMQVDFDLRSPRPDDRVILGCIDTGDGDRWCPFAETTAWCWQQGCMLQWRPGHEGQVIFNDRDGEHYVSRIVDVRTGQSRTVPSPIYAVSPDGRTAVTTDFRRLSWARPGYGYNGIDDPYRDQAAPRESGIWRVNLETGEIALIISLAQVAAIPWRYGSFHGQIHWFNHLLINPSGTRFVFLHRWRQPQASGFRTRMLSANLDGTDLRVLIDSGFVSHFIWRDAMHVLAYSRRNPQEPWGFLLWEDREQGGVEEIGKGVMGPGDGHCNYLPGNEWIVCDTYPDANRKQHIYLYHVPTNRRVDLISLVSPPEYAGEWRCDTHPRVSRKGQYLCIDSAHHEGRQMYLIDVGDIVG